MADPTPHWPGGAPAGDPPDGGEWFLDDDGLVIGWAEPTRYLSPEELLAGLGPTAAVRRVLSVLTPPDSPRFE